MPYPNLPSITPNSLDWGLKSNTQNSRSELNGSVQTHALPGDIWTGVFTYSNKFEPDASILRAFLVSLRGQAGRFYASPPGYSKRGSVTGTPLVKGASQVGSSLAVDGLPVSQTGVFKIGDYLEFGGELKMVTVDANSDSGGNATVYFTPPIRVSPADNSAVVYDTPKVLMMLADGDQARWQAEPTPIYALSIAVEEALS